MSQTVLMIQKAVAALQRGDHRKARKQLQRVLRRDPQNADALHLMGMSKWKAGDPRGGLGWVERACRSAPRRAGYHSTRGVILVELGRLDEAIAAFEAGLRHEPNHLESLSNLGSARLKRGDHALAIEAFERVARVRPRDLANQGRLGQALLGDEQASAALPHLEAAVRGLPDHARFHVALGMALARTGRVELAEQALARAVALEPGNIDYRRRLARAQLSTWRLAAAVESYQRVLAADPDDLESAIGLATVLHRRGDNPGAWDQLQRVRARCAGRADWAVAFGRVAPHLDRVPEARQILEQIWAPEHPEAPLMAHVRGALHAHEGDLDAAFAAHQRSHQLRGLRLDRPALAAETQTIIETFSAEGWADRPRVAPTPGPRPVFIVGMPRSGTSLVEQILASHPKVFGAGELHLVHGFAHSVRLPEPGPPGQLRVGLAQLRAWAQLYRQHLASLGPGAVITTDKLPQNYLYLGLIAMLFPDARIVHCQRDPLDTCVSCYFQYLDPRNPASVGLADLGVVYGAYRQLMQHWQASLPLPIHTVVYESLVADFEPAARALVDFVGLGWDPRCLDFHTTQRVVSTASYEQVRRPLYRSSVGRAAALAAHLGPLRDALATWDASSESR